MIAADGGAIAASTFGKPPEAIIGDLDSLPETEGDSFAKSSIRHLADQDSTDFDKCLRMVDAPLTIALGVLEPRIDHGLAAFNALLRYPGRRIILLSDCDVCCLAPPEIDLELAAGDRLSLFPMASVRGCSRGLKWPINGIQFGPADRIGTSNVVVEGSVSMSFDSAQMILILPEHCLETLARALSQTQMWDQR